MKKCFHITYVLEERLSCLAQWMVYVKDQFLPGSLENGRTVTRRQHEDPSFLMFEAKFLDVIGTKVFL
jgi:hypothetical protein